MKAATLSLTILTSVLVAGWLITKVLIGGQCPNVELVQNFD